MASHLRLIKFIIRLNRVKIQKHMGINNKIVNADVTTMVKPSGNRGKLEEWTAGRAASKAVFNG